MNKATGLILNSRIAVDESVTPPASLVDSSPYGNDGTFTGGLSAWTWKDNVWTLKTGGNYAVAVSASDSFNKNKDFTLSCWFKYNGPSGATWSYMFYMGTRFYVRLREDSGDTGKLEVWCYTGAWKVTRSTTLINTGNWYHVAGVFDSAVGGGTVYAYVNGVQESSLASCGSLSAASGTLSVAGVGAASPDAWSSGYKVRNIPMHPQSVYDEVSMERRIFGV